MADDKGTTYLHGYDPTEQKRLLKQARFLEPYVYAGIELEECERLLEVGCGVGAQTKILLRRFPEMKIDCVDLSERQLLAAADLLKEEIKEKRVRLFRQNAEQLDMKFKNYDAVFLCWFLEHVPDPLKVLKRVKNHLRAGGRIYCTEPFNQALFMEPYSAAYLKYWFEFNDYQWTIGGHPFIGAKLGNLLLDAGFGYIRTELRPFHFDSRNPKKRAEFTEYFFQILLSAEEELLKEKRVTKQLISQMKKEVEAVKKSKDAVFFDAFFRATAEVK
jgi:ubiquinone/menaquinone biosynthesis C-methylase UbiE